MTRIKRNYCRSEQEIHGTAQVIETNVGRSELSQVKEGRRINVCVLSREIEVSLFEVTGNDAYEKIPFLLEV